MHHFTIEPKHFEYLALQKGNLSDYLFDPHFWQVEYDKDIENYVQNVAEFINPEGNSILDIGSGLGGIDAALNRILGGNQKIGLLDGWDYPASVEKHSRPFNSMSVAKDFLTKNGVIEQNIKVYSSDTYNKIRINDTIRGHHIGSKHYADAWPVPKYDLILSCQAWCFHFEPDEYMKFVKEAAEPGKTVLILDVRNEKPDWVLQLVKAFGPFEVIFKKPKYTRMVFRPQ